MKKKKEGQEKGNKVLADYKKIGTTFVPPMVHRVGPWEFTSWSSQILPELIWWDVLSDRFSHRFAAQVAEEIAKHFKNKDKRKCWWAFTSDYGQLGTDDMEQLKKHLKRGNVLSQMLDALADFVTSSYTLTTASAKQFWLWSTEKRKWNMPPPIQRSNWRRSSEGRKSGSTKRNGTSLSMSTLDRGREKQPGRWQRKLGF